MSYISDGSNIPYSPSSLASPALVALALAAHQPLCHSHFRFQIFPAFKVIKQCSNKDKDEDQSNDDAAKDNDTCTDGVFIVFSFLLCFAADLCATLAKAERTRNRLVFDDHVPENGDRC